jgi:hypothetical protein
MAHNSQGTFRVDISALTGVRFFGLGFGFYHVEPGFDLYYCDAAGFSCDLIKWREALGARPPAPLFPHPLKNRFITFPQVTPFDLQGFGNPAQGGRS